MKPTPPDEYATGRKKNLKSRFISSGALLLLPVFVLVLFGVYSLVQDFRLVKVEAREQAQFLADQLAANLENEMAQVGFQYVYATYAGAASLGVPTNHTGGLVFILNQETYMSDWFLMYLLHEEQVSYSGDLESRLNTGFNAIVNTSGRLLNFSDNFRTSAGIIGEYDVLPLPSYSEDGTSQKSFRDIRDGPWSVPELEIQHILDSIRNASYSDSESADLLWQLAESYEERGQLDLAVMAWGAISEFDEAQTESGVPVVPLAGMRRAKLIINRPHLLPHTEFESVYRLLKATGSSILSHPSFLTPYLLSEGERLEQFYEETSPEPSARLVVSPSARAPSELVNSIFPWMKDTWDGQERVRAFFKRNRGVFQSDKKESSSYWVKDDEMSWLVLSEPSENIQEFKLFFCPESIVRATINQNLWRQKVRLPDFANVEVSIQGKRLVELDFVHDKNLKYHNPEDRKIDNVLSRSLSPRNPETEILAVGNGKVSNPDNAFINSKFPGLEVSILLSKPELLYRKQIKRVAGMGSLILFAAGTAVFGYWMSQRAYRKQLRLNEMKSNFVSSVSHELRAPIASVRLMAEGLESERVKGEGKQRQYFHFIVQECRRLTSLIENVLDYSRIEQNRKEYQFEESDMARLVEDTVAVMQPAAEDRQIVLRSDLSALENSECTATVDSQAIRQALINLIDNAIKHSPKNGNVTVSLFVENQDEKERGEFVLTVEDEGPGIPEAEREQIFERFYRRGSELRRETQGVGIGLSIVKHIVDAHSGTIAVENGLNGGSRFVIRIPVSLSRGRGTKGEGETTTQ